MAQIIKTRMWRFKFIAALFAHQASTLANYQRRGFPPVSIGLTNPWRGASESRLVHEPWAGWYEPEDEERSTSPAAESFHV